MLTIHKADPQGHILTTYSGCLLTDDDPILVLARWRHSTLQAPFVTFDPGDLFIERYDRGRYYNVFAVYSGEGIDLNDEMCGVKEQMRRQKRLAATAADVLHLIQDMYHTSRRPKGAYVNFSYPVEYNAQTQELIWRDLALDIWVPAQGQPLLLDEDEYALLDLPRREPQTAAAIQAALQRLWPHALRHSGPFALI